MTQAFNLSQLANNVNSSGQLDATDGLSGILPVANGGIGTSSLTTNAVVLGNGTSGVTTVSPSTSGNVLTSNGTTWVSQPFSAPEPTTAQVLSATAGASFGEIGTYAWLGEDQNVTTLAGNTRAGSFLTPAGVVKVTRDWFDTSQVNNVSGKGINSPRAGTWRCMGNGSFVTVCGTNYFPATLWLRIS